MAALWGWALCYPQQTEVQEAEEAVRGPQLVHGGAGT